MGTYTIFGLGCIFLAVALSIGGLLGVRRWLQATDLKVHHDVTDPLSQVVGMMFAILIGFMVSDSMQRFEEARSTVQQEAASLADIFNLAGGLPKPTRDQLRSSCITYAEQIIASEWPLLAQKKISVPTIKTYRSIWQQCTTFVPAGQGESNIQQIMLNSLTDMSDARRLRIEALHNGLPFALWWVLLVGGLATIIFTYFFGVKNTKLQIVMTGIVTLVICLNIFLLVSFDDPFGGDVMVHPSAFEADLIMFKTQWDPNKETPALEITP
ncbi:MAG: DUF4239 domain-containing protein [Candidatus Melainabacteria bacterium]|nr:DUF4239 domain-containing protein [Candidatus Melainabacteria bacterium]